MQGTRNNGFEAKKRLSRGAESGQVLVLSLVAMILIVIAIVLLFDIQNVIRGKVKVQNAVDAAALTGAEWQKETLNLIGDLNLVRATGVLISDPFFGIGMDPYTQVPPPEALTDQNGYFDVQRLVQELIRVDKEKHRVSVVDKLVSQLQTRVAFAGPLIGFGAAQQAAKKNGLNYNERAGQMFMEHLGLLYRGDVYGNEAIIPQLLYDYSWRGPYVSMIQAIMDMRAYEDPYEGLTNRAYGIAAGSRVEFIGAPSLSGDPPNEMISILSNKHIYEAIHGNNWCELKELLDKDFAGNWWGNFKCDFEENFSGQSEILSVHCEFRNDRDVYDSAYEKEAVQALLDSSETPFSEKFDSEDPYPYSVTVEDLGTRTDEAGRIISMRYLNVTPTGGDRGFYNSSDRDFRYNLLPLLNWAVFDDSWVPYSDETVNEWRRYLRSSFKEGVDYYSGALSYFEAEQDAALMTGKMGQKNKRRTMGSALNGMRDHGGAARMSNAQNQMEHAVEIRANAQAKPIGRIAADNGEILRPFEAGRMILPVFEKTALIPIALEDAPGFSSLDLDWFYFLTEYIPLLSESLSLDETWKKASERYPNHLSYFSYYHNALKMLDNEDFRQRGIDWLESPATWAYDNSGNRVVTSRNKDHCEDWVSGSSGGTRYGPASLH